MSKVALRVYNREIETLVDQGHIEEAIAHCQHILKLYPKHLETYRLLGKAYLEAHRHGDAADIFQRVLIAVPDDFVAQLGMSLVRDEQKDMDGAIWHMERAYEVNPSNAAVQGELRRLYGRRDGLEPPKIRLTRGALAHMYTKGGQYQQAIVEIKSVLAEDAARLDMKVLMARALYRDGQKVEATEICIELLKQFPFCLDANRILVEVLPGTSLSQNLDTYKKRVQALDPYAAQATASIFDIEDVPDNAITLERLEWEPGSSPSQDSYTASGQSGEAIPDFLRSSGWGPSTGEFQDGPVDFGSDEPAAAASGLTAAEIPDWLKAMAPPGSSVAPVPDQNLEPEPEDLDWLSGLGGPISGNEAPEAAAASSGDQPDWLKDLGGSTPIDQPPVESQPQTASPDLSGAQPDWMKDLGAASAGATGVAAEEGLDWLQTLNAAPEPNTPIEQPAATPGDDIDWLKNLGGPQDTALQASAAAVPDPNEAPANDLDWLKDLGGPQDSTPLESALPVSNTPISEPNAAPMEDIDWLQNLGGPVAPVEEEEAPIAPPPQPQAEAPKGFPGDEDAIPPLTAAVSGPGTSESEQDDAMNWLESLAQKQGAKPEELITNPTERTETAPDWLGGSLDSVADESSGIPAGSDQPTIVQQKPAMAQDDPNFVPGPLSPTVSGPGTSESEQDDAMKWLESLAEKQGAKPEELITDPGQRTEDVPAWATQTTDQPPAPPAPPVEAQPTPVQKPVMAQDDPNFVPGPLSPTLSGPGTSESEQDDAMKWLESLAEKQGAKPEELITDPGQRTEDVPAWATQTNEQPPAPPAASPVEAQPTLVQKPTMAQDDPNFVPGPLSPTLSGPGTSESEQDDAMKWLESLAEKQGAKPEELITDPGQRTEDAPAWAMQTNEQPPAPPAASPVEAQPTLVQKPVMAQDDPNFVPGPLSPTVSGPGTSESEQDDAMKWLESLAEKQGAKPEELITNPGERTEDVPAWATQTNEQPPAPPVEAQPTLVQKPVMAQDDPNFVPGPLSPTVSGPGTSESEQDDAMKWLESLAEKQGAKPEELITDPGQRTEDVPAWATQTNEQPPVLENAPPEAPPAAQDDTMEWLQGLGTETASDQPVSEPVAEKMPWEQEEAPAQPVEESLWEPQVPPAATEDEPQPTSDVSEWLKNLGVPDQEQPAPTLAAAAPADELPDWLNSTQQSAASDEDLPEWLKDSSADEQPGIPAAAAAWMPDSQAAPSVEETATPAEAEAPKLIFSPPLETPPPPPPPPAAIPASTRVPTQPVQPPTPVSPAVRQTGMLGDKDGPALQNARQSMAHGSLDSAISGYTKLIKRAKFLEEVIYDLKEATYTHPVDVIIWQTLGDAYMRANHLQDALDAYTRAEELLR